MADLEKVLKGLECCCSMTGEACRQCPYDEECAEMIGSGSAHLCSDALELLKEQSAIIDALVKVGYPHNFQREAPWIVNYMLNITDVVRKAIDLKNREEVEQGG